MSFHGLIQSLISGWFFTHEDEGHVRAAVEVRTLVSATRVRLPDVVVDRSYKWPQTLVKPPLIVIEVLSENDSYSETQKLARDYQDIGVPNNLAHRPRDTRWTRLQRRYVEGSTPV